MATVYGDEVARSIAAQWQSPGTIGHVLAQLASTGKADHGALFDDMSATARESVDAEVDMGIISKHLTLGGE